MVNYQNKIRNTNQLSSGSINVRGLSSQAKKRVPRQIVYRIQHGYTLSTGDEGLEGTNNSIKKLQSTSFLVKIAKLRLRFYSEQKLDKRLYKKCKLQTRNSRRLNQRLQYESSKLL